MKRSLTFASLAFLLAGAAVWDTAAAAAGESGSGGPSVDSGAAPNAFHVEAKDKIDRPGTANSGASGSHDDRVPCGPGARPGCRPAVTCAPDETSPTGWTATIWSEAPSASGGATIGFELRPCEPGQADAQSLPALVLRAFQAIPLPEATLSIQPPGGKTLVGLETILSTQAAPFTRRVTLLGQQIELRIKAQRFTWTHGDATTQNTDWPGKPWNEHEPDIDGYLTHTYEHTGIVRPSVTVIWEADYRVGGGPWQPVNGTVRREGAPAELEVVQAQPVLNGY